VQTFLPYADYEACARCLDDKRLGKQRVEVLQVLNALSKPGAKGWVNHPATNMWRGYEAELIRYGIVICEEWQRRGYRDSVMDQLKERASSLADSGVPPWMGDERIHSSHRANLLRKDEEFYRKQGWTEPVDMPYHWPVKARRL